MKQIVKVKGAHPFLLPSVHWTERYPDADACPGCTRHAIWPFCPVHWGR